MSNNHNIDNFFEDIEKEENRVGQLIDINYETAKLVTNDFYTINVKGLQHGSFLIAIYNSEYKKDFKEGILLRVLDRASLPTDKELQSEILDTFMENPSSNNKPDWVTKHYQQFSGRECKILGTFFFQTNDEGKKELIFGTDIENFLTPTKYQVYKPKGLRLEEIVNTRAKDKRSKIPIQVSIGKLRYSSSKSYLHNIEEDEYSVDIYLKPQDILARRTAFFGMTRTGKSNTIKIAIEAVNELNKRIEELNDEQGKIGQLIFDINGEYSFPNSQDDKSIYEKHPEEVVRFSTSLAKVNKYKDVQSLQLDFYDDKLLTESFSLLYEQAKAYNGNLPQYLESFFSIDFTKPSKDDYDDDNFFYFKLEQYKRKISIYKCILHEANFQSKINYKLNFKGISSLTNMSIPKNKKGLTFEEAKNWFKRLYDFHLEARKNKEDILSSSGEIIIDKDFETLLEMLLAKRGGGYKSLIQFKHLHSTKGNKDFKFVVNNEIRKGKIVLIDLSSSTEDIQQVYINKLCSHIFQKSLDEFTNDQKPKSIQLYFEEAHNIFPKDDKDLKNIYNRLAKEGAKLHIGLSYSTQEVSSISPSILKNTQNWFISHLNNVDEIKILSKYHDFIDFSNSIMKNTEVGYARIKMHSNDFIIPVQINKF
jgi:DNA helicase HerA-like ATPase